MKNNRNEAVAMIRGNERNSSIQGVVLFQETEQGVHVRVNIKGISVPRRIRCNQPILAMHIHEGISCRDPKTHYNPNQCPHPYHAGDLGNLFVNKNGTAIMSMVNDRFRLEDVIGKTVILHQDFDDFKTQPSGNSDGIIACGVIRTFRNRTSI